MKKILIIFIILILIFVIVILLYNNIIIEKQKNIENELFNDLYLSENSNSSIENNIEDNEIEDIEEKIPRKKAYYDEDGFVTDSLYIDFQIYCTYDNDNIKTILDSRIEEIRNNILTEPPNSSGMVVINLSGNTKLHEKLNVLEYNETLIRYKMLKTYFDETFSKNIMVETNKPKDSNIFNADLENNKNISYTTSEEKIYYSVKTGQKIQNVSDLFSTTYDYVSLIKERVKYMLDINIGYSENEVNRQVNDAYSKLNINIDLLNERLIINLEEDGFEMYFNEFDKTQMTIYK